MAATAHADVGVWVSRGPSGGEAEAIVVDPVDSNTVYAATAAGVFKSVDGAETWHAASAGLTDRYVAQLAIDPVETQTLYAATRDGVFKSVDGAATWTSANVGLPLGPMNALAIDPHRPATLLAGEYSGTFRSHDAGATWHRLDDGPFDVGDLVFDPTTPGVVYAAASTTVDKSTDGGDTWARHSIGVTRGIRRLAIDPHEPHTLYASAIGFSSGFGTVPINLGVFKSADAGVSWSRIEALDQAGAVYGLIVDPYTTDTVYAGTFGVGILKSTDGGQNWTPMNTGIPGILGISPPFRWAQAIAVDPQVPDTVYSSFIPFGVFKTENGGDDWASATQGIIGTTVSTVAVDPFRPGAIYAGVPRLGVFTSIDGADSWTGATGPTDVEAFAVDALSPGRVYAAVRNGVLKSDDGGATWHDFSSGIPNASFVSDVAADPRGTSLYAAARFGVYKRDAASDRWVVSTSEAEIAALTDVEALAVDPTQPDTLYAGGYGGILKSIDGGAVWERADGGVPQAPVEALVVDPTSAERVYAALGAAGAYRTTDGGRSWHPFRDGLEDASVMAIAIDPTSPATLYCATYGAGIFTRGLDDDRWEPLNTGLTTLFFVDVKVDTSTPRTVYAASFGHGVFALQLEEGPGPGPCAGDCNANGRVTIDELITGVNVALGRAALAVCSGLDADASGTILVNELVRAVNRALHGC